MALGPAFAAGFAVQRLLELLDPITNFLLEASLRFIGVEQGKGDESFIKAKAFILSLCSLSAGLILAVGAGLRVLEPLGVEQAGFIDLVVTGLIISAGTEGVNAVLKFLDYAKLDKKADAQHKIQTG